MVAIPLLPYPLILTAHKWNAHDYTVRPDEPVWPFETSSIPTVKEKLMIFYSRETITKSLAEVETIPYFPTLGLKVQDMQTNTNLNSLHLRLSRQLHVSYLFL
jgi:hypothetical protein